VALHDRFKTLGWMRDASARENAYELTANGVKAFDALGIEIESIRKLRRRFAYGCVDWSERRPHLGGALGAAVLNAALQRKWVAQELDSRALTITKAGRRELSSRFGISL
jgi:hypothetical protein